jgi:hypothetical protein
MVRRPVSFLVFSSLRADSDRESWQGDEFFNNNAGRYNTYSKLLEVDIKEKYGGSGS